MISPVDIQKIGDELAIRWDDGVESYFTAAQLRDASPSAETRGEKDLLGRKMGGVRAVGLATVQILGWEIIGNYALRFDFSAGHRTGLYSFEYLIELANSVH